MDSFQQIRSRAFSARSADLHYLFKKVFDRLYPVTENVELMDKQEIDLRNLDSEKTEDRGEHSQASEASAADRRRRRILTQLKTAEDERRELNYSLFQVAIITEQETKKIKSIYDKLVTLLRSAILHPPLEDKKETYKAKLEAYCEEFIDIVDTRVIPHFWVAVQIKGTLLRLKADYLRYLFEINPKNGSYQVRAHNAYTEAKTFFIAHRLTKSLEWYRLRLNYAALLYLDGFPTAAMFICQQLLRSSKLKSFDAAIEQRVRRNVEFFKRACLG
ncbi:unnamed protein product [Calicophoron daubneyi]|uniref:14-3-3 domain-containing protein n=1 Tax=Calicophoron daubneyi TaxID=300641 RepID=A0AAV2TS11_CALDB